MSYQEPWLDPMETGEMDPAMMDQAYIDFLVANGAGAGMVPDYQMTGKPLTVQNKIGAVNANRSALFDTAFQGLGGPQAFAPGAFDPIVSTSIRQSPELNQMYGYLRAPDSYEGLIANEILNGGNASTALRKIHELLVNENTDPALKTSLLLELPQRPGAYDMPAPERTVENVNWDVDENSVAERSRMINELYAQIPRVGPSEPQWTIGPDGTPVQTSAGGELSWGEDESGNPVLIETTVTESEAAKTYSDLGLPNPAEEYTPEHFMSPEGIAMGQELPGIADIVAQYKAAWMDPSLAPSNWEPTGPAGVPAAAGWGGPGAQGPQEGGGGGNPFNAGVNPLSTGLAEMLSQNPQGRTDGIWNSFVNQGLADVLLGNEGEGATRSLPGADSNLIDVMTQNPQGRTDGIWNSFLRQGLWDVVTGNEGDGGQPSVPSVPGPDDYPAGDTATFAGGEIPQQNNVARAFELLANGGGQPQPRPISASDQLQNQAQAESRAPDWLSHAPGSILTGAGGAQAPSPVTIMGQPADQYQAQRAATQAMLRYTLPEVETGEHAAQRRAQREEDEQQAQILGGSTDRTGKRVRPTRTAEQARRYRAAFDAWDRATDEQHAAEQQYLQTARPGYAKAMARNYQEAGIRPLDQAMMARRLVLMNAGMPQGV